MTSHLNQGDTNAHELTKQFFAGPSFPQNINFNPNTNFPQHTNYNPNTNFPLPPFFQTPQQFTQPIQGLNYFSQSTNPSYNFSSGAGGSSASAPSPDIQVVDETPPSGSGDKAAKKRKGKQPTYTAAWWRYYEKILDENQNVIGGICKQGVKPDGDICTMLVRGFCREGNLTKAETILTQFVERFGVHDNQGYNALVRAYCEETDIGEALELQERMAELGFVANAETCKSIIYGLSK